jgi:hypothetical protein
MTTSGKLERNGEEDVIVCFKVREGGGETMMKLGDDR